MYVITCKTVFKSGRSFSERLQIDFPTRGDALLWLESNPWFSAIDDRHADIVESRTPRVYKRVVKR